jgi:hypothetical protein
MPRFPIDDTTADRLLAGGLSPEDAPPGYAGIAGAIRSATGPTVPAELAGEDLVVAAGAAAVRSAQTIRPTMPGRQPMLTKMRSAKVAAFAVAAVLGASGVAAAATGNLPAAVQSTVSHDLGHVSIAVPHGHGADKAGAANGKSAGHKPSDKGANAKADFGQCTAFLAGPDAGATGQPTTSTTSGKLSSTAFSDLIADHGGTVASTTAYCTTVVAAHNAAHADKATGTTEATDATEAPEAPEPTDAPEPPETGKPAGTGKPSSAGKPADAGKPSGAGQSGSHPTVPAAGPGGPATSHQP